MRLYNRFRLADRGYHRRHLRQPQGSARLRVRCPQGLQRRRPHVHPRRRRARRSRADRRGRGHIIQRRHRSQGQGRARGSGQDVGRVLRPSRRAAQDHRRNRHQGQDHYRGHDPLHPRGRRAQDRHHRHPGHTDRRPHLQDQQHHPRELRDPAGHAPYAGRGLQGHGHRGFFAGTEVAPHRRHNVRLRRVHQLLQRPYRRQRA